MCRGVQSPQNVAVKEEVVRLGKRLKAAERELEEKRKAAAARDAKITKLKQDLDGVVAGLPLATAASLPPLMANYLYPLCTPHCVCSTIAC